MAEPYLVGVEREYMNRFLTERQAQIEGGKVDHHR